MCAMNAGTVVPNFWENFRGRISAPVSGRVKLYCYVFCTEQFFIVVKLKILLIDRNIALALPAVIKYRHLLCPMQVLRN